MSGRRWAYAGVILGFSASITANIASTVLKETDVSLWLRVPFAIFWPLATYIAIEVLVRIDWRANLSHRLTRLVLAGPVGLVAAFVSYLHQHHLMKLAGEPGLAQGFGPLAVDGMLFGMTAALIVTRVRSSAEKAEEISELSATQPIEEGWAENWEKEFSASIAPTSPAPIVSAPPLTAAPEEIDPKISEEMDGERTERVGTAVRRSSWDARQVAELILAGVKTPEIVEKTGAKPASIGRFRKVAKILQEDPRATIDPTKEKVTSDNIRMIRELVSR